MSFQDWCDWACNQPNDSGWPHVANIAEADAKYDADDHRDRFQQDLGSEHPQDKQRYREICWRYPLKGTSVSGAPSEYLTRCKKVEKLLGYNRELVRRSGDIDRRNHGNQYRPPGLSGSGWRPADEALEIAPEYRRDDFFVARPVGAPDDRCVFATPQDGDDAAPSSDGHTPQFYRTIQSDRRPGETEADCAVYRLAIDVRGADRDEDWVLLYYPRTNIEEDSCLYPVPPDAGFHPQFKPVPPNSDEPFGRTCPGEPGDCDDDRAEPELVHPNVSLTPPDVWILPLDNDTPAS